MDESTYRFDIDKQGTITRGRAYRLPSDWTTDEWRHYWDGDLMVAVYDSTHYSSPTTGSATERVEYAMAMCREYDQDIDDMLTRLARRIEGNWYAGFVPVPIEQGVTLYALMWDASDEKVTREWVDEIEAVYHGEIYRIEVEQWDGDTWQPAEEVYETYYGEAQIEKGFAKEFPLTEVPDSLLVTSDN